MNKRVLLGMTLMASLAFYSCTKEVVIVQEGGEGGIESPTAQDGQVLTLQVANTGDGLTTRAGRPLLSSQAKQDINTIVLYVVKSGNVVLKKTIGPDEWANALDYSNTSAHGKQLQITFRASDKQKLTAGDYTIYAVGYKTETTAATSYKVTDADFGVKKSSGDGLVVPTEVGQDGANATLAANDFSAQLDKTYNNSKIIPADEIFAGVVEVTATEDYLVKKSTSTGTKVVPALVLNRQVAGVTGYFTNLPAKVGTQIPAKIRLVASGKSNKVHFTSMLPGETGTDSSVKNVVNGSWSGSSEADAAEKGNYWDSSNKGYIVYEIDLKSFFPMIGSEKTPAGPGGNPAAVNYTFADMDLDGDGFVGYKDAQYYVYDLRTNNALKNNTDGGASDAALEYWEDAIKGGTDNITVSEIQYSTKALSTFWKNPNDKTQTLVAGSVFAGEFIIPFLQVTSPSNVNTFELQLLDENGKILKNWNVQVPTVQKVTSPTLAEGISSDGKPKIENDKSTLIYNVYRNHLYSLGLKTTNIEGGKDPDPEKPVDPKPNPDPDEGGENPDPEDQPEDLSKGQDLLLNVNDNWEIIHQMEID